MDEQTPRFNTYRPTRVLGEGGMGMVWEGRTEYALGLSRPCAIKFMKAEVADNPLYLERFAREARLGLDVSTDHPNIVTTRHFGKAPDGQAFLAMDLVVGPKLEDIARMLRDDFRRIRYVALQVLSVLSHLREHKLVHRDISPANILIDHDGVVKVIDFGLAKRIGSSTSSGNPLGALPYMSPEIILHGQPASYPSDLYSLGVVLFELLTGRAPYGTHPFSAICHAMKRNEPLALPGKIPVDLRQLLTEPGGLLDHDPASRMPIDEACSLLSSNAQVATRAEMAAVVVSWLADRPAMHPPSENTNQSEQVTIGRSHDDVTLPHPGHVAGSEEGSQQRTGRRQQRRALLWVIPLSLALIVALLVFWRFSVGPLDEDETRYLDEQFGLYQD